MNAKVPATVTKACSRVPPLFAIALRPAPVLLRADAVPTASSSHQRQIESLRDSQVKERARQSNHV